MDEVLFTGEMNFDGYEYPFVCPLKICGASPPSVSIRDGVWTCDECGKEIVQWVRATPHTDTPIEGD